MVVEAESQQGVVVWSNAEEVSSLHSLECLSASTDLPEEELQWHLFETLQVSGSNRTEGKALGVSFPLEHFHSL